MELLVVLSCSST